MNTYRLDHDSLGGLAVQALDHVPYGIVIITEAMKVILHNETAATVFSDADGITIAEGHLELLNWRHEEFRCRINEHLKQKTDEDYACVITFAVERLSGRLAYQVIMRPLSPETDNDLSRHHGVWIVSINDPEQRADLPRDILRDYYRLTDAEIEVCRLLFHHGRIDNVCVELGVSRNTVKTHLMHIYTKCGVRSQSMLIMRLTLSLVR